MNHDSYKYLKTLKRRLEHLNATQYVNDYVKAEKAALNWIIPIAENITKSETEILKEQKAQVNAQKIK